MNDDDAADDAADDATDGRQIETIMHECCPAGSFNNDNVLK